MPSTKLVSDNKVSVSAVLMVTLFHKVPNALVMLASSVTLTLLCTKYAAPVSLLCTVALAVLA